MYRLCLLLLATACFMSDARGDTASDIRALREELRQVREDLQFQMFHVGASAACAGVTNYITPSNSYGPQNGQAVPHTSGKTCTEV